MQNAFAALAEESDDYDDDVQTVITQMAALTAQNQLTASTAAEMSTLVTAAINQLAANQQAMQQQFAAFATARNTMYQPETPTPPPMQFNIPNFGTFQPAGLEVGGRWGGRGRGEQANNTFCKLHGTRWPRWTTPHWRRPWRRCCAFYTTKCVT